MRKLSIFENMNDDEITYLLKNVGSRKIFFKKDELVFSNLSDNVLMGIIISGSVNIIKYDDKGNRIIIDNLKLNSIFGKPFIYDRDLSVIASSDSIILFIDYSLLTNNLTIMNNIVNIFSVEMSRKNERIELLSKKTIREKLLCYFYLMSSDKKSKTFNMTITYIELSDILSVDRSAMMRELRKMKNEKLITINGKKITILK